MYVVFQRLRHHSVIIIVALLSTSHSDDFLTAARKVLIAPITTHSIIGQLYALATYETMVIVIIGTGGSDATVKDDYALTMYRLSASCLHGPLVRRLGEGRRFRVEIIQGREGKGGRWARDGDPAWRRRWRSWQLIYYVNVTFTEV